MSLLDVKRKEIYETLIHYNGNKTKAAAILGMSIRSLRDLTNNDPFFLEFKGSFKPANRGDQGHGQ
jgi:Bacterial regulatory protein, Fis family